VKRRVRFILREWSRLDFRAQQS